MEASITPADLGADWTEADDAGGFFKSSIDDCLTEGDSPLTGSDLYYSGPSFEDGTGEAVISSQTFVFSTEEAARQFTDLRDTEQFADCRHRDDSYDQSFNDDLSDLRLSKSDTAGVDIGGLVAYYEQETVTPDDTVTYVYSHYTFRTGPVVYVVSVSTGVPDDAESAQALHAELTDAINGARSGIDSRLASLDL